jgi:hypothetical protein
MIKRLSAHGALLLSVPTLAACNSVETKTSLMTPATGIVMSAGPGDSVMSFQSRRSLPNAFGKADLFGRTTNAGGTTVRYLGTRGGQAVFERSDVQVMSNATTMSETPLIIPHTTNTNITGRIGTTPVYGSANSTSYQYIPARGSSQYATASQPIQFSLGNGQSVKVSGKTLRVVRVGPASVDYRLE